MKKAILWILGILLALVVAVLCIWGREIRTVSSIESVDGSFRFIEIRIFQTVPEMRMIEMEFRAGIAVMYLTFEDLSVDLDTDFVSVRPGLDLDRA